jgi:hypothetical protein
LVHIGLADEDGPGGDKRIDNSGAGRGRVGELGTGRRGGMSGKVDIVLDRERQAIERQCLRVFVGQRPGGGQNRVIGQARDPNRRVGVVRGAGQNIVRDLFRCGLPRPVKRAQGGKIEAIDAVVHVIRLSDAGVIATEMRAWAESWIDCGTMQPNHMRCTVFQRFAKDRPKWWGTERPGGVLIGSAEPFD